MANQSDKDRQTDKDKQSDKNKRSDNQNSGNGSTQQEKDNHREKNFQASPGEDSKSPGGKTVAGNTFGRDSQQPEVRTEARTAGESKKMANESGHNRTSPSTSGAY